MIQNADISRLGIMVVWEIECFNIVISQIPSKIVNYTLKTRKVLDSKLIAESFEVHFDISVLVLYWPLSSVQLQYASLLGLATLTKRKPVLCLSFNDQPIDIRRSFSLSAIADCPASEKFYPVIEKFCCGYDKDLVTTLSSNCERSYRIYNFTQSWRYFNHIRGNLFINFWVTQFHHATIKKVCVNQNF